MKNLNKLLFFVLCTIFILNLSSTVVLGQFRQVKRLDFESITHKEKSYHLNNHIENEFILKLDNLEKLNKLLGNGVVLDSVIFYRDAGSKHKNTYTYDGRGNR